MKKTPFSISAAAAVTVAAVLLSGCSAPEENMPEATHTYQYEHELNIIDDNYRNYYQVFVYSFCDSNGDGIGDLAGVTSKLDYIQDMGFNGIWLSPIMSSDSYHKYSVKDYCAIDEQYGTMQDFEELAAECEKRGIKLLIDLVMNHSSNEHEWFRHASQSLRSDPCGAAEDEPCLNDNICPVHDPYIDYYYFADEKPAGTNTWYQTGSHWYEAIFSERMPELNLDNTAVRAEFEKIADFWLEKGAGGFRLDAVKEYFSGNPDKNIEVLEWFMQHCKAADPDCYVVGEVWESFTTYTKYYKSGIDSVFGFTMAEEDGKIAKTINMSGSANSVKSFTQAMVTVEQKLASYSETAIDAPFIGNHDTNRGAGIFGYDETKIKAAAGLLLTMSGSPFVYYGDEIGLTGSGRDENKRAPMIWDSEGTGLTYGPPNMERQENRFADVQTQLSDENSILNYYKRALRIRNENPCIARGTTEVLNVPGQEIAAIRRTWNDESIVIVYNYSDESAAFADIDGLSGMQLRGYLTVDAAQEVTLEEGLNMPAYSIAFLTEK